MNEKFPKGEGHNLLAQFSDNACRGHPRCAHALRHALAQRSHDESDEDGLALLGEVADSAA